MARSDSQSIEHPAQVREAVESVWIAVVLAFVLRAFVLEAFVIPTGSMAPRLMGRHWQFDCPVCAYHYAYGIPHRPGRAGKPAGAPSICPNCRCPRRFGAVWAYGGDRVLVLKYLYRFGRPKPWDVVVFKNPQDNEQNYIKRLIGLPGQMIEIVHGDVFVRDAREMDFDNNGLVDKKDFDHPLARTECPWRILRKPARTQKVMWQVVFDNDYQPDPAGYRDETHRAWQSPWRQSAGPAVWDTSVRGGRVFAFAGASEPAVLRFVADRHCFCPNYAYNQKDSGMYDKKTDINYDLKLSFTFVPKDSSDVRVGLHMSSFKHHFRVWLNADGRCLLKHGAADKAGKVRWDKRPLGFNRLGPLQAGRAYQVALTHVDHRVEFHLDSKMVLATTDAQYPADREQIIQAVKNAVTEHPEGLPAPTVAILADGGPAELWHIRLMRDVYYTCPQIDTGDAAPLIGRGTTDKPMILRKFNEKPDMDEFFVLGDNSPASLDSRLWDHHAPTLRADYRDGTVPRYNLIGKAFFVYWPGGYRLPVLNHLPIVPNVGRMRLIR